ncbi:MAG TPA: OsmC family protein [Spirochaetia bacterium]|nr:OsmC family protein [Spirochaetia bacterium]
MADYTAKVTWEEEMAFDVELQGHHFKIDADEQFGGRNKGPKPKALLLAGLAGCTGMDVVSILGKMRMSWDTFHLEVDAAVAESHPQVYTKISIRYIFGGESLDKAKIERAVNLSRETYCAVSAMLEKTAQISHEIILNV